MTIRQLPKVTQTKPNTNTPIHISNAQLAAQILKAAEFFNGDPTFFTPTFVLNRRVDDQLKNPYSNAIWVYAAVSAIATNLIQLPKVLDLVSSEEQELIKDNPILELLEKPNALMDGPTFWENIILDLMLPTPTTKGGQCFLIADSGTGRPVNLRAGEIPREIFPFSDDFMEPIVSKKDNMLEAWKFRVPGGSAKTIIYKPEEVIRIFLVDPRHPLKGQAPIWADKLGLATDIKAQRFSENFFDNNASIGGVLEADENLDKKVADEVRLAFEEKYAGTENAGKLALLHSGIKYKQFTQNHVSMQFLEQRQMSMQEVLAAYRVPKFAVSLYEDLNFATATAAMKTFWTQTLIPHDNRILRAINNQWINFTNNGNVALISDTTNVIALQADLTEKLKQAESFHKLGVPLTEINRRLELALDLGDVPWADDIFVSFSQTTAENLVTEAEKPQPEEDEDEVTPPEEVEEENPDSLVNKLTDVLKQSAEEERIQEVYLNQVLIPDEKRFTKLIKGYLTVQRNKVLDQIDIWENSFKAISKQVLVKQEISEENKPDPSRFTNFKAIENRRLQKETKPEYERDAVREGKVVEVELGGLIEWQVNSPTMKTILRERLRQITSINTTTFKIARNQIREVIDNSINNQLGIKETARKLKKAIGKVYNGRINSLTIARTEISSIHSQTRFDIYQAEGIKKTKWLTAQDEAVRTSPFSHKQLNNKVRFIGKGFNNGEKIMFPLDPRASASNVINCRCTIISQRS